MPAFPRARARESSNRSMHSSKYASEKIARISSLRNSGSRRRVGPASVRAIYPLGEKATAECGGKASPEEKTLPRNQASKKTVSASP